MSWKCVDCGHEEAERWLMCPECTTADDWAAARTDVLVRHRITVTNDRGVNVIYDSDRDGWPAPGQSPATFLPGDDA